MSEVVPKADVSSRSFEVKVTGPCPPGVYSGMFGRLMLPLEDEQVLLAPAMSPMALNVPVAMLMSMLVAFTITPWLSYHILTWGTKLVPESESVPEAINKRIENEPVHEEAYDPAVVQQTLLYLCQRMPNCKSSNCLQVHPYWHR